MERLFDLLLDLNEDNYEHKVEVNTKEELIENMTEYFYEQYVFNTSLDEDDYINEDGDFDEEKYEEDLYNEKREHVKDMLMWEGKGTYCLAGVNWGESHIAKVDECLKCELENINDAEYFPVRLSIDFFNNTKEYIKKWKKDNNIKYIYLVTWVHVVGNPYYRVEYVVESNKEMSEAEVFEYLNDERGIFVGEFNQLGCNYFIEEIEDFDSDLFTRYNTREGYKLVIID